MLINIYFLFLKYLKILEKILHLEDLVNKNLVFIVDIIFNLKVNFNDHYFNYGYDVIFKDFHYIFVLIMFIILQKLIE